MPSLLTKKPDLGGYEDYLGYDIPAVGPMPMIAKEVLMPILAAPVKGKGAEVLLNRIFDFIPETFYKGVKSVDIVPKKSLAKKAYGQYMKSSGAMKIEEPSLFRHPPHEYVDTAVHEVLHEGVTPLKLGKASEEKIVEELTRHYVDYGATGVPHKSLSLLHEGVAKPPATQEELYDLLAKIYGAP